MWSGLPLSTKEAIGKFDVDEVKYVSEIESTLISLPNFKIFTTDIEEFKDNALIVSFVKPLDNDFFYALDESRLIKDDYEISLMRHAAKITDNSHLGVMSALPIETNETHLHAEFLYHSLRQGSINVI